MAHRRPVRPRAPGRALHRADPGAVRRGASSWCRDGHRDRAGAGGAPTSTTTRVNGELRARKGARLAAATSGGAIPETGDYRVVAEPDDTFIGTVNEDWAVESMAGDIFLLGTHSWQIRRVEPGVVRVRDAGDAPPDHPVLAGRGARPAPPSCPTRCRSCARRVDELPRRRRPRRRPPVADRRRRRSRADAATMIVDYLAVGRAVLGRHAHARSCLVLERFFDDTGGMQLVVHSPYGGRINRAPRAGAAQEVLPHVQLRAAGRRQRRRHRAVARARTTASRSTRCPATCRSRTVADTLEHAILDSPMFQARWRWNLNRSLMVLRFRNGRRNPPPIQRMESDDLHGRGVPAGRRLPGERHRPDRDPRPPARAPDDRRHAARGARRRRPRARCSSASRPARCAVHCADTTEPSVLAHEILTARPYAFLDDEEFQNRRTNAVHAAAGPGGRPGRDRRARPRGHRAGARRDRARARPRADDLHDLLSSLVLRPARGPTGGRCSTSSPARGRGAASIAHDGRRAVVHDRGARRGRAARSPATTTRSPQVAARPPRDRRHHHRRRTGRRRPRSPTGRVAPGWPRSSSEGFALQGRYTARCGRAPSGWPAGCWPACTRTPGGPGASRSSRPPRRTSCGSCCAGSTSRPAPSSAARPGWSPCSSSSGLRGRGRGLGARAARPPAAPLRARPGSTGCATTARSPGCASRPAPATTPTRPPTAPSKATPISVVLPRRPRLAAGRAPGPGAEPAEPTVGRHRRDARGAARAGRLLRHRARRGHPPAARRHRAGPVGRRGPRPRHVRRLRRHPRPRAAERVARSPVATAGVGADRPRLRPGRSPARDGGVGRPVVASVPRAPSERRSTATSWPRPWPSSCSTAGAWCSATWRVRDSLRLPWRDLQWALRRLEDRGLVRGGRFVSGFSGEQYALPAAAEQLGHVRKLPPHRRAGHRQRHRPAQPGRRRSCPGDTVPAVRTNRVTYVDGVPEALEVAGTPPTPALADVPGVRL